MNSFKGNLSDTVYLVTGNGGGDCGYNFKIGIDYLIYAREQNYYFIDSIKKSNPLKYKSHDSKNLTTTICDRTTNNIMKEQELLVQALQTQN